MLPMTTKLSKWRSFVFSVSSLPYHIHLSCDDFPDLTGLTHWGRHRKVAIPTADQSAVEKIAWRRINAISLTNKCLVGLHQLGQVSDREAPHRPSTRNATRVKKGGRNYTFYPILMKNMGRNTTFSSWPLVWTFFNPCPATPGYACINSLRPSDAYMRQ